MGFCAGKYILFVNIRIFEIKYIEENATSAKETALFHIKWRENKFERQVSQAEMLK